MSMARWDPWSEVVSLREAMSHLLEESVVRPRATGGVTAGPAIDVRETPDTFVLTASVPGFRPDDVTIAVLGDRLTISGRPQEERPDGDGGRWLLRERQIGAFERKLALPAAIDADRSEASFQDGVLTITMPKAESAKPRTINVRAGVTGQKNGS